VGGGGKGQICFLEREESDFLASFCSIDLSFKNKFSSLMSELLVIWITNVRASIEFILDLFG
jgi:hypothetical protein